MEKEWIKVLLNKEVDGFLSKNTFKKWGRNFIMSIANGEQALFNIIDDLVNKGKIDVEDIKECFN